MHPKVLAWQIASGSPEHPLFRYARELANVSAADSTAQDAALEMVSHSPLKSIKRSNELSIKM
eukprot:scaffold39550_cov42-Prasinocladus_malaysianus.AAC.2